MDAAGPSGDGGGVFVMIGETNGVGVAVTVTVAVGVSVTFGGTGVTVGIHEVRNNASKSIFLMVYLPETTCNVPLMNDAIEPASPASSSAT